MIESNKKVMGIVVFLLTATMLVAPAMATPATKIEGVTATTLESTRTSVFTIVDHSIVQVRHGEAIGMVTINIPGQNPLIGTVYREFKGTFKLGHGPPGPFLEAEGIETGQLVFSFTGEGTTGTFKGVEYTKMIGFPVEFVSYMNTRLELHGTGDFLGQTLKLSFEGNPPPIAWEGYILIP